MSKPFSSMFARRYSKRQVTNRDFNFVRDWNADPTDGRATDSHDTFSTKVTPRARYIISSSKPSPAHGNHHIPGLSDLISSSPIPVVVQSPPARAIPYQQAAIGEEEDEEEEEVANEEDEEEEVANEDDEEEEEMAEEEESGGDGDASTADSTMAVKDDGESESDSFVVEATIRHAQKKDVNSTSHHSRKETTPRTRYSTSDHVVSGGVYSDHSETIDNRADESDREKDGGQQAVHHDEEMEEEEEEQVDGRRKKSNINSMYVEKENNDLSSKPRSPKAKDKNEEKEGIKDTRFKKMDRKISSLEEENVNNRSSPYLRARSRSRGNNPEDNVNVQASTGVLHCAGLPNETEKSNRDIEADSDDCTDGPSSQNQRNDGSQRNRSIIQTNRSGGYHIETVLDNEMRERDGGEENEKSLRKNRHSVNNRENLRYSVSKSPKQAKNFNKSRSADQEQQTQTFERRKTGSGKKERLTRHSSMEQNVSDEDVSKTPDSDLEEEETAGERRRSLSESKTQAPPEGATDEEENMEEIGDEDMEEDVTQDQMSQDEITQEETAASIMIQSTIHDTPITTKSPKKLKRSLVDNIDDDNEKEDDDDTNVDRPAAPVPPPLKQKKISFSSETKKSEEKKRKEPVHQLGLWQGEMDKRYKKSVLDLDIVLNDLDNKLQVASDDDHLTTMKKKECQLFSHIRKRITSTIEAVEETRQKRTEILRTKRNIKESRTELLELQQKNIRLSKKLGNEKNENEYQKKLLTDWITSFETLMVASRNLKTKSSMKGMVSFGYLPKIQ